MESNEVQELKEHAEHAASDSGLRPVAFTMSLLAVLVAVTTVPSISHLVSKLCSCKNKATDKWNEYQAHKIRSNNTALISDLLSVVTIADKDAAAKIQKSYADHQTGRNDDLKELMDEATAEAEVNHAEKRADRFDSPRQCSR